MSSVEDSANGVVKPTFPRPGLGALPSRLRLLCVGAVEPSWVSLALLLDARGCLEPNFCWKATANDALTLLREESFDCLLIRAQAGWESTGEDPVSLARAIRVGGSADPIVVVTPQADDDAWTEALTLNVELLVTPKGWASNALVHAIERAVERGQMLSEIERLGSVHRQRVSRDREEAEYLFNQQRQILLALEALRADARGIDSTVAPSPEGAAAALRSCSLPPEFDNYYYELIRSFVIMGTGSLTGELAKLAAVLVSAGLGPRDVLTLHLDRVATLVRGLGNRSTRHVIARADLLALELMVHVGEALLTGTRRVRPADPNETATDPLPPPVSENLADAGAPVS
jgi:hypothetical protein